MNIVFAAADAVMIYCGTHISQESAKAVKNAFYTLKEAKLEGIIDIVPSYTSILVNYDIFVYDLESISARLQELLSTKSYHEEKENIVDIEVYYAPEVGLDLEQMAEQKNMSISSLIELHASKLYDVYAIGFLPGFAYLASVPQALRTPRLSTPRKSIPKGSVAIADAQTAIYPEASPGGWNIIGRTARSLFDKTLPSLSPLAVGDKVRFVPIDKERFLKTGGIL